VITDHGRPCVVRTHIIYVYTTYAHIRHTYYIRIYYVCAHTLYIHIQAQKYYTYINIAAHFGNTDGAPACHAHKHHTFIGSIYIYTHICMVYAHIHTRTYLLHVHDSRDLFVLWLTWPGKTTSTVSLVYIYICIYICTHIWLSA